MLRYLFVDMNSYFASVEQQEQPELREKPVAIIPMLTETTCCIAASYEAKAYGVRTGTPVWQARRMCPGLRLVEARPRLYVRYHHRIVEAVESCLHVDEVCSVDEMYGRLMGRECRPENAAGLARRVKQAIRDAAGQNLRCSVGLAPNVWLAKVATDLHKPDGLTVIRREDLPEALEKLELTDLPGIASRMQRRLNRDGVFTVAQLCRLPQDRLQRIWGSEVLGSLWWRQLRGYDMRPRPTHRRTVGHSHVLPPAWRTPAGAHATLTRMIHKAAARLRRTGYRAGRITFWVRRLAGATWQSRRRIGRCRDTLTMLAALASVWGQRPPQGKPYHVGVVLDDLVAPGSATLPLWPRQGHLDDLAEAMDRVNARYGNHTLYFAGMHGADETAPTRISFTQIPEDAEF